MVKRLLKYRELVWILTVVMVVVGVSLYQLQLSQIKSRDSQRRADTELVGRAMVLYYKENGFFPPAKDGAIVACGDEGVDECVWGNDEVRDVNGIVFLKNLPNDPLADQGYEYVYTTDESQISFSIFARLENTRDVVVRDNLGVRCGEYECNWLVEN